MVRYRRPADQRARPQRWYDTIVGLIVLQAEYSAWAEPLSDALQGTATAEALQVD